MSKPAFEFWFDFASPYSFLTAMRMATATAEAQLEPVYRPFMLGIVLREAGWEGPPVANNPAKARYMWRDIQRRALLRGHGFSTPSQFPRNPTLANRLAQLAADEGWAGEFVPRAFAASFVQDQDIGEAVVLGRVLAACGQDPEAALARAQGDANRAALRANTEAALSRGIFGAPSFTVGEELFWGDDRLEDALEWWQRS